MKNDCVFCQIVKGEIPSYKIFENERFFGFLDINPRVPGHSLLIPKAHYRWVYQVPEFAAYWEAALQITQALQRALAPTFITYVTHGLEVPHAHIHILPRQKETAFVPETISLPKERMAVIARLIANQV